MCAASFRRFTDTNVYGTGSVEIWKTHHNRGYTDIFTVYTADCMYHVCRDDDMPVADGVVGIESPVWLFRRDEDTFRLTDKNCRYIVTTNRCHAVIYAHIYVRTRV